MKELWACMLAEFRALGYWCVAHGPEFWLGLVLAAACAGVAIIFLSIVNGGKKR